MSASPANSLSLGVLAEDHEEEMQQASQSEQYDQEPEANDGAGLQGERAPGEAMDSVEAPVPDGVAAPPAPPPRQWTNEPSDRPDGGFESF